MTLSREEEDQLRAEGFVKTASGGWTLPGSAKNGRYESQKAKDPGHLEPADHYPVPPDGNVTVTVPVPEGATGAQVYTGPVRPGMKPLATTAVDAAWTFGPCTVKGQLGSKSNSRKIVTVGGSFRPLAPGGKKVRVGGRPALVKSADALAYVEAFRLQVRSRLPKTPYTGPVELRVVAYYVDRVRDLDIALLQDCLQADPKTEWPGILKNDRQVVAIHAWRRIDKKDPRVVFDLKAVAE